MKLIRLALVFILSLGATAAMAQTESDARDVTVKITNKRGKPVKGVVVQSVEGGDVGITDQGGYYVFKNITQEDQIRMFLPNYGERLVPVEGLDSLRVVLNSSNQVAYYNDRNGEELNIGYGTTSRGANTTSVSQLDAEKIVAQSGARDLLELLNGRIAGLTIGADGSARIRGTTSIMLSSEPLVVVDGVAIGTLQDANSAVSIYNVKTVSVLKEGSIYGSQGANGVILITTK